MPARAKSLQITDRYRRDMVRLRQQGQREAKRIWNRVSPSDLDGTFNVGILELTVSTLQKEAARLSSAYLSAFIASELGEPQRPPALTVWDKTFNGNPLREGLRSAVIKAKMAIKDGQDPRQATNASRDILVSDVGLFIDIAARESLRQGMEMDERIVGYKRAIKGTCEACMGMADGSTLPEGTPLDIHPNAVLEGSTFASYGELHQMIAARYAGPAVKLRTANGHGLTIGPNHPMLTGRGWIVASELHQGDQLVYDRRSDLGGTMSGVHSPADLQQMEKVEDSFETLRSTFGYATVAGASYDFHGDRDFCVGEVEVVRPERRLLVEWDLGFAQQVRQSVLVGADAELAGVASLGPRNANGQGILLAASGGMGGSGAGSAHYSLQLIETVDFVWFEGWAFDASAESSLYCSNGFVVANCECVSEPVVNAHQDRLDAKSTESLLDRTQYALTSAERDIAQRYQGFDSLTPNKFLRAGKPLYEHDQRFVNGMDRLMDKAGSLGKNMQVYRGIPAHALEEATGRSMSQLEGLTFRDLGFGSTTPLRERAAQWGAPDIFAANKEKTLWDITLSKDVKALWMESATGEEWGLKELVVQRGCRYVIEKVVKREGVWHVKATLLPPK